MLPRGPVFAGRSDFNSEGGLPADHKAAETAVRVLGEMVGEGIFAVGGQICVIVNGDIAVDVAIGKAGGGGAMASGVLHNVYCLFKPLSYLLLGGWSSSDSAACTTSSTGK